MAEKRHHLELNLSSGHVEDADTALTDGAATGDEDHDMNYAGSDADDMTGNKRGGNGSKGMTAGARASQAIVCQDKTRCICHGDIALLQKNVFFECVNMMSRLVTLVVISLTHGRWL